MSFSLTPEQVAEEALRERAEMDSQVKYLQTQLGQLLEEKRRWNRSSNSPHNCVVSDESEREKNSIQGSSSEEGIIRRPQGRREGNFGDFNVDVPEFEGQLDLDHFLDWLQTVERVFEYKDILDDKKVKLVGLKFRKYAFIWWANVVPKRARKEKGKIRTWTKMRGKLKSKFLPSYYL